MLAPDVKSRQNAVGIVPEGSASRAEFVKFIHNDTLRSMIPRYTSSAISNGQDMLKFRYWRMRTETSST